MTNRTLNTVVETAKAKAANSPKWLRAIERAAAALASGKLVVTLSANDALVTSPRGSYRVNGHCACEAARRGHAECYHMVAVRLTELPEAASPAAQRPVRVPKITRSSNLLPTTNFSRHSNRQHNSRYILATGFGSSKRWLISAANVTRWKSTAQLSATT
jgi:hypothetical protein